VKFIIEKYNFFRLGSKKDFPVMKCTVGSLLLMAILLATATTALCDQADDYNNRGATELSKRNWDAAIADFTKAIELKPSFAEAYNNRGYARTSKGSISFVVSGDDGDLNAAIADFTNAIKLKPDYAEAYRNRGLAKSFKKDFEGAIPDFTSAIQLKPDFRLAYIGRGAASIEIRDFEGAIADFTSIIQLKPDDAFAYHRRGEAKQAKGDTDGANADYAKALQIEPDIEKIFNPSQPGGCTIASVNPQAQSERIPIVILGASSTKQAEGTLVLAVSWIFSGREGGVTVPDASSAIIGISGIAGTASGPVALSFSMLCKKADNPSRVYFKAGEGNLQLWWSGDANPATPDKTSLIQLSSAWLAASTELPATSDHPAGGILIPSHLPNGEPLVFYLEFTDARTLVPGPRIKGMGTE
jgi:tetratricopeptide (TPR) repeat protein